MPARPGSATGNSDTRPPYPIACWPRFDGGWGVASARDAPASAALAFGEAPGWLWADVLRQQRHEGAIRESAYRAEVLRWLSAGDAAARFAILEQLPGSVFPESVPALVRALEDDAVVHSFACTGRVSNAAAHVLAESSPPEARSALVHCRERMRRDEKSEDTERRSFALAALATLGDPRATAALEGFVADPRYGTPGAPER